MNGLTTQSVSMQGMNGIPLPGCRHDVLGHHLKAWGILRALHQCAPPDHLDREAEGWWDLDKACFYLKSPKYDSVEELAEFLSTYFQPTSILSAWNTGGGLDEKKELHLGIKKSLWTKYLEQNKAALIEAGMPENPESQEILNNKLIEKGFFDFPLKSKSISFPEDPHLKIESYEKGKRKTKTIKISWSDSCISKAWSEFENLKEGIQSATKIQKNKEKAINDRKLPLALDIKDLSKAEKLAAQDSTDVLALSTSNKSSGKEAVMEQLISHSEDTAFKKAIETGRRYFVAFKDDTQDRQTVFHAYRDEQDERSQAAFDAIVLGFLMGTRLSDNPVFLNRGDAGRAEIFRSMWVYFLASKKRNANLLASQSLAGSSVSENLSTDGKGAPFFPDAIKTYNNGSGWVVESFPFNALDYILAVEGALSLRGSASRTLAANSRRFAAFPFVFETGEDMTDDSGDIKGTAKALWLPLWEHPTCYSELASFVCDAQSRLPGKEARFSSEFARALRAQGVDAGFTAWQEFRYKMKASRIPWVCTGTYIGSETNDRPLLLTDALAPLDESNFLEQFIEKWKGTKIDASSPHHYRERINAAIERAIASATPENALEILTKVFEAANQLATSKSFRSKTYGARFFRPLPPKPWDQLLSGLNEIDEFLVARALASMTGRDRQPEGGKSEVQPMLGSLLPVKLGPSGWYLPEQSPQAVWTGNDLYHDLAMVLQRRYLDSLPDQLPALQSVHPAPIKAVLALLRGELNIHQISRWTEALSLIGWHHEKEENADADQSTDTTTGETPELWHPLAVPPSYAVLRALLKVECECQGPEYTEWQKRRSRIPFALLCQRTPGSVSKAISESLHWLSIWGVPNPERESRKELPRLQGKSIIRPPEIQILPEEAGRLPAAVCVPLTEKSHSQLYREITVPAKIRTKDPAS